MFRKQVEPAPAEIDQRLLDIIDGVDPEVLREAVEAVAEQKVLDDIEERINEIGRKRSRLMKEATELTHQREELLGEELSAVSASAK